MSKYALIIVDMVTDNVNTQRHGAMDVEAKKIIPAIRELSAAFRQRNCHIVFACDSFMRGDFIFRGRMQPHAIRGTGGDQPIAELEMQSTDLYLPKRRMSAFYKTDLDQTLRTWGVDTAVVCGIVTYGCVLLTALDAIQNDFCSILVSDASACHKSSIHEATLKLYDSVLVPMFRIMSAPEIVRELKEASTS